MKNKMEMRFLELVKKDRLIQKDNSFSLSPEKYLEIIKKLKCAKQKQSKEPSDYKLLKRYDVLNVAGVEKLIAPVKKTEEIIYFVHDEEIYQILAETHTSIGHGGRDRMMRALRKKYKNITYKDVNMFLSICEPCLQKQKRDKKVPAKPLLMKQDLVCSRCQVDLIDYQSQPDDNFKFIMVYQDYLTKFLVLKALKSNSSEEVSNNLIDIFTLFGAPLVIQSDSGTDFLNNIIKNFKLLWPELRLIQGEPSQNNQGTNEEGANQDIETMLKAWMQDNQTLQWSQGLRFVQLMRNKSYHSALKKTPYEALFGQPIKLGLTTSALQSVGTLAFEPLVKIQEKEQKSESY